MANNSNKPQSKSENAVVYNVMTALLLLGCTILGLRYLRGYYGSLGGFEALDPMTPWFIGIGFGLFAAAAVVGLLVKAKTVRTLCPWIMAAGFMIGLTACSMRVAWTADFPSLYFVVSAMALQLVVFQLYRWEFFLFSLSTACAGFFFFRYSTSFAWNTSGILILAGMVIIILGTALVAKAAAGNKGMLVFGRKRVALFPAKSRPTLIYVIDILWLICIAAALVLGGLFAYYCMFAAIAVEFIAAVYYTFQLN